MSMLFDIMDEALTVIHNLDCDDEPTEDHVKLAFKQYTKEELEQILEALTKIKTLAFVEKSKRK